MDLPQYQASNNWKQEDGASAGTSEEQSLPTKRKSSISHPPALLPSVIPPPATPPLHSRGTTTTSAHTPTSLLSPHSARSTDSSSGSPDDMSAGGGSGSGSGSNLSLLSATGGSSGSGEGVGSHPSSAHSHSRRLSNSSTSQLLSSMSMLSGVGGASGGDHDMLTPPSTSHSTSTSISSSQQYPSSHIRQASTDSTSSVSSNSVSPPAVGTYRKAGGGGETPLQQQQHHPSGFTFSPQQHAMRKLTNTAHTPTSTTSQGSRGGMTPSHGTMSGNNNTISPSMQSMQAMNNNQHNNNNHASSAATMMEDVAIMLQAPLQAHSLQQQPSQQQQQQHQQLQHTLQSGNLNSNLNNSMTDHPMSDSNTMTDNTKLVMSHHNHSHTHPLAYPSYTSFSTVPQSLQSNAAAEYMAVQPTHPLAICAGLRETTLSGVPPPSSSVASTTTVATTTGTTKAARSSSHAPSIPHHVRSSSHNSATSATSSTTVPSATATTTATTAKRGSGFSCHACKTHKPAELLLFCTNQSKKGPGKKRCRKKYCDSCLKRLYGHPPDQPLKDVVNFQCPACLGSCLCAGCERKTSSSSAAANGGMSGSENEGGNTAATEFIRHSSSSPAPRVNVNSPSHGALSSGEHRTHHSSGTGRTTKPTTPQGKPPVKKRRTSVDISQALAMNNNGTNSTAGGSMDTESFDNAYADHIIEHHTDDSSSNNTNFSSNEITVATPLRNHARRHSGEFPMPSLYQNALLSGHHTQPSSLPFSHPNAHHTAAAVLGATGGGFGFVVGGGLGSGLPPRSHTTSPRLTTANNLLAPNAIGASSASRMIQVPTFSLTTNPTTTGASGLGVSGVFPSAIQQSVASATNQAAMVVAAAAAGANSTGNTTMDCSESHQQQGIMNDPRSPVLSSVSTNPSPGVSPSLMKRLLLGGGAGDMKAPQQIPAMSLQALPVSSSGSSLLLPGSVLTSSSSNNPQPLGSPTASPNESMRVLANVACTVNNTQPGAALPPAHPPMKTLGGESYSSPKMMPFGAQQTGVNSLHSPTHGLPVLALGSASQSSIGSTSSTASTASSPLIVPSPVLSPFASILNTSGVLNNAANPAAAASLNNPAISALKAQHAMEIQCLLLQQQQQLTAALELDMSHGGGGAKPLTMASGRSAILSPTLVASTASSTATGSMMPVVKLEGTGNGELNSNTNNNNNTNNTNTTNNNNTNIKMETNTK